MIGKLDESYLETIELKPGAIVIDCGVSVGDTIAVFLKKGATVHAFEPNPMAIKTVEERFAGVEGLILHSAAVYDRDGRADFYFHEDLTEETVGAANGSSLLAVKGNVNSDEPHEVQTIDLAKYIQGIGQPIAFLKIDIEGAEIEVVNHLLDLGAHTLVDQIVVETHERKIPELTEPTEALRNRITEMGATNIRLDWH